MKRRGFTLVEVVLAIGLMAMVVYLLMTATELYLANVDASRTRVETAQLARTLLDQIANDLANVRVSPPPAGNSPMGGGFGGPAGSQPGGAAGGGSSGPGSPGGSGGATGGAPVGTGSPGQPGGPGDGTSGPAGGMGTGGPSTMPGGAALAAGGKEGVYGDIAQLRIDRLPYANWERATREVELQEASSRADMPVSVRYFFVDKDRVSSQSLAQKGVAREISPTSAGGLYRETMTTASISPDDPPLPTSEVGRTGAQVELLAPEVLAFALTYFDGTDLVEEWDSVVDRGLPRGVEIRLTIAEPQFQTRPSQEEQQRIAEGRFRESERVEYVRFVRLPLVSPSAAAQSLLPMAGGQGGGPMGGSGQPGGGQGSGQPGDGQSGGGQPGGAPSQGGS